MTAYFYQFKRSREPRSMKIDRFRFMDDILLHSYIEKHELDSIFDRILVKCHFSVIGYDKFHDKYWCKRLNNTTCELHFDIKIMEIDNNSTLVKILPLIGTNNDIKIFVKDLKENLQLYRATNSI
jgi:hypothetical protein